MGIEESEEQSKNGRFACNRKQYVDQDSGLVKNSINNKQTLHNPYVLHKHPIGNEIPYMNIYTAS